MSRSLVSRRARERRRLGLLAPGAALALALLAGTARADGLVFTVNTSQDLPDASPGDGVADADLEEPGEQTSLRAAVMEANAIPGPDEIVIPDGVWKLSLKGLGGAENGDLDVTSPLTVTGTPADPATKEQGTILDAKLLKDRFFDVIKDRSLVLRNLTLRGGKSPKIGIEEHGGAVRSAGVLELEKVIVTGCSTHENGGAIAVIQGTASLALTDVLLSKCVATGSGGGVWVQSGQITAQRATWQSCKAKQGVGGGLAMEAAPLLNGGIGTLTNVTFSGNSAKLDGGAIFVRSSSVLTINNGTLADNVCKAVSGLASDGSDGVNTVLLRNTLLDNKGKRNATPDGPTISLGGNVETGTSCGFVTALGDLPETEPWLLKLKNWGGFTPTRALKSTSPAIDHGTDAGAPLTDQRGVSRVDIPDVGELAQADCGAFEYEAPED